MTRQYLRFEGGADPSDPSRKQDPEAGDARPHDARNDVGGLQTFVDAFTSLRLTDEPTNEWLAVWVSGSPRTQQMIGSKFLAALNAGHETVQGVDYRVIAVPERPVVTPPEGSFLVPGPGSSRPQRVDPGQLPGGERLARGTARRSAFDLPGQARARPEPARRGPLLTGPRPPSTVNTPVAAPPEEGAATGVRSATQVPVECRSDHFERGR